MFLRKEKETPEQVQVVIKEGNTSNTLYMGIPEGIAFVSRLLQLGAFKVEVTRSPKFTGNLDELLKELTSGNIEHNSERATKELVKNGQRPNERYNFYNMVSEQYGELRRIDAIGIVDSLNKQHIFESIIKNSEDKTWEASLYIAAMLRIMGEVIRNIDYDTLTPDERRMLGGNFIKDLEGLKRYLGITAEAHKGAGDFATII